MDITSGARRSPARLFCIYAAVTFVPVVVLGIVLAITFRSDANRRGLSEGRSEAALIAQTAVEPQLDGRPLRAGLSPVEAAEMKRPGGAHGRQSQCPAPETARSQRRRGFLR